MLLNLLPYRAGYVGESEVNASIIFDHFHIEEVTSTARSSSPTGNRPDSRRYPGELIESGAYFSDGRG